MSLRTLIGARIIGTPASYVFQTDHKAEKMYCIEFTVIGRGHFPYDMLRYDMCHPVDSTAANAMHFDYAETNDRGDERDRREIKLRTWSPNKYWEPTYGRWASFGWQVTTDIYESQKKVQA